MIEVLVSVLLIGGSFFIFVAALGILRLPDVYTRMHAASKVTSLGMGLVLTAAMVRFGTLEVIIKSVLAIFFIFLTAPLAAHALSRAAYLTGSKRSGDMVVDELEGVYPTTEEAWNGSK